MKKRLQCSDWHDPKWGYDNNQARGLAWICNLALMLSPPPFLKVRYWVGVILGCRVKAVVINAGPGILSEYLGLVLEVRCNRSHSVK